MKASKSFLFILLFLIPVWNLMAATQHVNRNHLAVHHRMILPSNGDVQLSADLTEDDDSMIADDDDGDDISETLIKSVPVATIFFSLFESTGSVTVHHFISVPLPVQKTSLPYLRVFRI